MPNYQNGKIYKIVNDENDKIYFGSTTLKYLSTRLVKHRCEFKAFKEGKRTKFCSVNEVLKYKNYKIILIENYPCNSKDELISRERYYIEKYPCVNKEIPGRSKKQWYEDNKEKIIERVKLNTDKIQKKNYDKEYRKLNDDKIKSYRNESIICECGCSVNRSSLAKHRRTKKHLKLISE